MFYDINPSLRRPVKLFHSKLEEHVFMALCMGALSELKHTSYFAKQLGSTLTQDVALTFIFIRTPTMTAD